MPENVPSLLLLIPAYNEERRIGPVLRDYAQYFRREYGGRFQVLVVLNGCRDHTRDVVEAAAREFPEISFLEFPDPIGKGGALIEGLVRPTNADLVGFVDADGATQPAAFHALVRRAGEADCVIGSRWLPDSVVRQSQSWQRKMFSRVFHAVVQLLFWMNIRDTQCGAKVMRRTAVEKIRGALRIADLSFDINLLYSLKRTGATILEVPTEWTDQTGSKVALNRTTLAIPLSLLRLRLIYSPLHPFLKFLRPLEGWIYGVLRAPAPRRASSETPAQS